MTEEMQETKDIQKCQKCSYSTDHKPNIGINMQGFHSNKHRQRVKVHHQLGTDCPFLCEAP